MNDVALSLLAGTVSAVISAVVTYFVTRLKVRLDLMVEYDKKLRGERLDAYKELWKLLKPLARFSPATPLTYQIIQSTSESMRDWYFDVGGIYLSSESRKPYFDLKASLQGIIDNKDLQKDKDARLTVELNHVLEQGRKLRNSLSDDIGTRREPFV